MIKDFKSSFRGSQKASSLGRAGLVAPGLLLGSLLLLALFLFQPFRAADAVSNPSAVPEKIPASAAAAPAPAAPQREILSGTFAAGETVSHLFSPYLSPQEILLLAERCREVFPVSQLRAGHPYQLFLTGGGFEKFVYEIDAEEQLVVSRGSGDFSAGRVPIPYQVEEIVTGAVIQSSLFNAVAEVGESPELAIAVAEIFAWDIDFIRDIREGDSFTVLVPKRYREGNFAGYGKILAAEFRNRGDIYRAYLFEDEMGRPAYFDEEGKSLRKAFLKAPLAFSRISSGFTQNRLHPVLKVYRPHPAIAYAAPTGTPIHSVGDGVVTQKGFNNHNGNCVRVRHLGCYETLYNHMSRFAPGIRVGSRVSQGQVIGYVGATGLATGPHLDFRMYRNGSPINPLTIKPVATSPVKSGRQAEFQALVKIRNPHIEADGPVRFGAVEKDLFPSQEPL